MNLIAGFVLASAAALSAGNGPIETLGVVPVDVGGSDFVVTYSNALPPDRYLKIACVQGECRGAETRIEFEDSIISVFRLSDSWPGVCVHGARGSAYSLTCLDLTDGRVRESTLVFKALISVSQDEVVVRNEAGDLVRSPLFPR